MNEYINRDVKKNIVSRGVIFSALLMFSHLRYKRRKQKKWKKTEGDHRELVSL